jgi:hypothetical protein
MENYFLTVVAENGKKLVIECARNENQSNGTGALVGSKVRTLKVVDDAVEQAKIELANAVCPDWRIDQAVQEVFDTLNGGEPDVKRLGDVIKWVTSDIMKEELHKFAEAKIEPKQVMPKIGPIVKQRFFEVHYVL